MLPRWAFGYHQGKASYDDDEAFTVAREMRRRKLPFDAIYYDDWVDEAITKRFVTSLWNWHRARLTMGFGMPMFGSFEGVDDFSLPEAARRARSSYGRPTKKARSLVLISMWTTVVRTVKSVISISFRPEPSITCSHPNGRKHSGMELSWEWLILASWTGFRIRRASSGRALVCPWPRAVTFSA